MSDIKEKEDLSSFNQAPKADPSPEKSEVSYRFKVEKVGILDASPSIIADKGGNETPKIGPSPFKDFQTPGPEFNKQFSVSDETGEQQGKYPTPAPDLTQQAENKEGQLTDSFKSMKIHEQKAEIKPLTSL